MDRMPKDWRAAIVAGKHHVKQPQRFLRRIANFFCQQDSPRASSKNRHAARGALAQRTVQPFGLQEFPLRGALASGKNNTLQALHLRRPPHEPRMHAQALEGLAVSFEVSLNRKHTNFHGYSLPKEL